MGKFSLKRISIFAATVVIVITSFCIFAGCASTADIRLTAESIELYVGESRDILPYVDFLPASAESKSISLTAVGDCVEIDGSIVKALKKGSALVKITSDGGAAELNVTVVYPGVNGIALSVDENVIQTVSVGQKPKPVTLSLDIGLADPELAVVWTADGVKIDENTLTVVFEPQGYGEYEICAEAAGNVCSKVVRAYKSSKVTASYDGTLDNTRNRTAVKFFAEERIDPDNPPSVFEWFVNGEKRGDLQVFEFLPRGSGRYDVSLKVNGVAVDIDGEQYVTVTASGDIAPECRVEFDDRDGVYVVWDDDVYAARVSIIPRNGVRRDIDRSDAQHSYMFGSGYFDATEFIDVCAEQPQTYKIYVQTEGVSECAFTQYPITAQQFLSNKPFIKNMFISSADDGIQLIEDLYACGKENARAYSVISNDDMNGVIYYARSVLGVELNATRDGNIVTFEFDEIKNAPEYHEDLPNVLRMYSEFPHIEYEAALRRQPGFVYASDRTKRSVAVSGSEQLFLAVTRGYRPIPAKESTAELVYTTAKNRLLNIIGAGYDDFQKLHAIYDWMQWVGISGNYNAISSANYLESFFGSVEIGRGDVRRAVVSEYGASKIFAFLCAIEGIECEIVTDGNRYRNKVKLFGIYYNVDVLGGKARANEIGITRNAELNTHSSLLISDEAAVDMGLFDASSVLEAFDDGKTVYLKKVKRDKDYFDGYITDAENYDDIKAAVFYSFSNSRIGAVSVPVLTGTETYMNNSYGAEFVFGKNVTAKTAKLEELLTRAATEYARDVLGKSFGQSIRLYRKGNNIHLTASVT